LPILTIKPGKIIDIQSKKEPGTLPRFNQFPSFKAALRASTTPVARDTITVVIDPWIPVNPFSPSKMNIVFSQTISNREPITVRRAAHTIKVIVNILQNFILPIHPWISS
jgi:hypothetical protein